MSQVSRPRTRHTRIVEHDVNSAKGRFSLCKGGGDVDTVGHVHSDDEELSGGVRCQVGEDLGFAERGNNFVSDLEQILGRGETKTRRGTSSCSVQ